MRTTTAADITKLAHPDRLPLFLQVRRASLDPNLHPLQRAVLRVAARYLWGNTDSPMYDLLARLQILEGVSGLVTLKPMVAGPWSKNPRLGVKAALDHFAETAINPEWFSLRNTGLISKIRGMVRQEYSRWTRGREVHFDPDDIIQNGLMGLTKDGDGQLAQGPLCIQFGHSNPGIRRAIPEGRATPADVAGIVGRFFVQKVSDQFQKGDKARAPSEDALGHNVLDQSPDQPRDVADILADALSDPHSPIRQMVFKALRPRLGEGKWAEIALTFLEAQANGEEVNKGALAEQYGIAGGTLSKILREKVYPALEAVQKDSRIQEALEEYADRMRGRRAAKRLDSLRGLI